MMAINAARRGDHAAASRHAGDAADLARSTGDFDNLTEVLIRFIAVCGVTGDLADGIRTGAEMIDSSRSKGDTGALARFLSVQAWLLAAANDLDSAGETISEAITAHEARVDQSLPLPERYSSDWGTTMLHTAMMISIKRGDDAEAAGYSTALLNARFYHHDAVVGALVCAAIIAAGRGEDERATRLAAGVARVSNETDSYHDGVLEPAMSSARRALGSAKARAAAASGHAMTIEQLVRYALSGALPVGDDPASALTPREHQIAQHVAQGLTNAQITTRLSISQRTVASHLAGIRAKLDLRSRVDIALWAARPARSVDHRATWANPVLASAWPGRRLPSRPAEPTDDVPRPAATAGIVRKCSRWRARRRRSPGARGCAGRVWRARAPRGS